MPIRTIILLSNGLIFLLIAIVLGYGIELSLQKNALQEAETKAHVIMQRYLAVHDYFANALKPAIFELTSPYLSSDYFDPHWMSSTYAVRSIDATAQEMGSYGGYYYKEAAINARTPENEADVYEKEFIQALNANPNIESTSGIRKIDGETFYVTMHRGEMMQESCLPCHSTPSQAPDELVEIYGSTRSFNRQVGEMISAISIRIPLAAAYAEARDTSIKIIAGMAAALFLLFALTSFLQQKLLLKPLETLKKKVIAVSENEAKLGEQVKMPFGRELVELAQAFNLMSSSVRQARDLLEERVDQRTAELEMKSDDLQEEIHLREEAENFLRAQNEFVLSVIDSLGYPFYVISLPDRAIMLSNKAAEAQNTDGSLFCYQQMHRFNQPCHLMGEKCPVEEILATKKPVLLEHFHIDVSGESRIIELHAFPILNTENEVVEMIEYTIDITGQRKTQTALMEAEKMAGLGVLSAGVAHEINSPLQVITGISESVLKKLDQGIPEQAELHKKIESINTNAWRIAQIVRSLLTYARSSLNEVEKYDLNTIIEDTLLLIEHQYKSWTSITIEKQLQPEMPEIKCNRNEISQAVINLLINARDAMPKGGLVTISTGFDPEKQACWVTITDTGEGIPMEIQEAIFKPFFTTKPAGKGTGLGLSIVQGIVQAHQGTISLNSQVGKGTSISMFFPVKQAAQN